MMCTCAAGCDRNPTADPGVFPRCRCWCHDRAVVRAEEETMNDRNSDPKPEFRGSPHMTVERLQEAAHAVLRAYDRVMCEVRVAGEESTDAYVQFVKAIGSLQYHSRYVSGQDCEGCREWDSEWFRQ